MASGEGAEGAAGICGCGFPQRLADLAIPSALASAARASSTSGAISRSGRVKVSEKISQCRLASFSRPIRAYRSTSRRCPKEKAIRL